MKKDGAASRRSNGCLCLRNKGERGTAGSRIAGEGCAGSRVRELWRLKKNFASALETTERRSLWPRKKRTATEKGGSNMPWDPSWPWGKNGEGGIKGMSLENHLAMGAMTGLRAGGHRNHQKKGKNRPQRPNGRGRKERLLLVGALWPRRPTKQKGSDKSVQKLHWSGGSFKLKIFLILKDLLGTGKGKNDQFEQKTARRDLPNTHPVSRKAGE